MAPQLFSGKYVIQEEIARGGMGVILKALDRALNRVVAIKLVHAHLSGDASFVERFLREARAMARLQHDNIVTIYEWGEEDRQQYLVMEFFGPSNLRTLVRQPHRLPLRDIVSIGHQLSSALAYAHAQSIIHRDIKPANVLIDKKGKAKLTDFGIAAALDEASITSTGQVIGTPEYMSPEQARGVKLDGRSDLYSLGIMLYEMLTGKAPYADTSKTAILGKLVFEQQELSLQFPSDVPSLLQGVVRDLLRRNPDDRIPDADTLASQLHEIMYTLPQSPTSATSNESEPTIVSVPIKTPVEAPTRMAAPPLEQPVEPLTKTILQPRTDIPPVPPSPAAKPTATPLAQNLDETTLLPAQTPAPPKYVPPERSSTSAPPPPLPATSSSVKLLPLVGGSIMVVALLVGLISYLASRPITPSEAPATPNPSPTSPLPSQPATSEGPAPSPTRTAQAEELEKQRKQLEEEANRLEEKKRLAAVQQAKEEAERRELERQRDRTVQRAKEEELQRKAAEEKARAADQKRLEAERTRAAEAVRAEEGQRFQLEQQRRAEELAKLDRERQQVEARRLQEEAELKRLQAEREKAAQTAREEEQLRQARLQKQQEEAEARRKQQTQVASLPPPAVVPSLKLQTGPDQRLRALMDRFKTAYEGHDLSSLQAISQMSESRAHNVAFMFSNYSTLKTSIQNLTVLDDRATATIIIDQAIKLDGEVVSLSPIAKTIKIQIPKQGEEWGKISW